MRQDVLGVKVDCLDKKKWLDTAVFLMKGDRFNYAITVNSLLVLDSLKDPSLETICDNAALLVPDSSGFVWAHSLLNDSKLERYAGVDFAFDLCAEAAENNIPVFLL